MKLSQKKNCNGCKGGWNEIQPFWQHCELGFDVTTKGLCGIPQEACYKPLTNSDYMTARRILFPRS